MVTLLAVLRLPLTIIGLIVLYAAERYLSSESYHVALRIAAVAMVALSWLSTVFLTITTKKSRPNEAKGWRILTIWQFGLLASLCCYLGFAKALGDNTTPETPASRILLGAWLVLMIVSLAAGIGAEWAMRTTGRGEAAEPNRVGRAMLSWVTVGLLLSFLVTVNYVGDKKDVQSDWSYLKVSSPSEATQHMVKSLSSDLTVALFYPQSNEVKNVIESYFNSIAKLEPKVKLLWFDKDINPVQRKNIVLPAMD